MKTKLSKKEAEKEIQEFFKTIHSKSEKNIKKIKRLAMKHNIKLGDLRKRFCKKCYNPIKGRLRIKKGFKTIECSKCKTKNRWKIK